MFVPITSFAVAGYGTRVARMDIYIAATSSQEAHNTKFNLNGSVPEPVHEVSIWCAVGSSRSLFVMSVMKCSYRCPVGSLRSLSVLTDVCSRDVHGCS